MTGRDRHVRPAVADQRAVLDVAAAVLAVDQKGAHAAACPPGTCPACTVVAAVQLGYAFCAAVTGAPFVTGELHARLAALVEAAATGLREAGN